MTHEELYAYVKSVYPKWEPNPHKGEYLDGVTKLLQETGTSALVSDKPTVCIRADNKYLIYAWDGKDTVLAECVTPGQEKRGLYSISEWIKWTDYGGRFLYSKYEADDVREGLA